jgi:hypothetical protein
LTSFTLCTRLRSVKFTSAKKVVAFRIAAGEIGRWHRAAALEDCSMAEMVRAAVRDRVRALEEHEAHRRELEARAGERKSVA